ncbi:MAG: hypothetical protein ABUL49_00350, partial [bacterium]
MNILLSVKPAADAITGTGSDIRTTDTSEAQPLPTIPQPLSIEVNYLRAVTDEDGANTVPNSIRFDLDSQLTAK